MANSPDNQQKDIRLNTLGRIVEGDESGCFVRILDDSESTGGFLILTSIDRSFEDGFNDWVEDAEALDSYWSEAGWTIEWLEDLHEDKSC